VIVFTDISNAHAAEITTGAITGTVRSVQGAYLADVAVSATAASGRYQARTDSQGAFSILGVTPDTYTVVASHTGYEPGVQAGVVVQIGETQSVSFALTTAVRSIGTVTATGTSFKVGATSDTFIVSGAAARASSPVSASSGLATFTAGTVQGSASSAPGISFDALGNVSTRGGKVDDTVFTYDSVPIPQGLVVNPGGNFVGAQTPTTGVGETTVALAGFESQSDNALGGVVNQVPVLGAYPAQQQAEFGVGSGALFNLASYEFRTATPDLRSRLAVSTTFSSEFLSFGDGRSFYPGEASVVGIGLQDRGLYSLATNYHIALTGHDDVSIAEFNGSASYDQYGSPFAGQTIGLLDGTDANGNPIIFPGSTNQRAPVTSPSRTRGFFNVIKGEWLHSGAHSVERAQIYQSFFGADANGPFWDDNAFGSGAVSLVSMNTGRLTGVQLDGSLARDAQTIQYGIEYRVSNSILDEFVPTNDEYVHSNPTLQTTLSYAGDTWQATRHLAVTATARFFTTHVIPHDGFSYTLAALDPHVSASYKLGSAYALRATYDHNTVAPKPLETDLVDSTNVLANGRLAPFVPLAPERGDDFTYSLEGGGRTQFRMTYFQKFERDRIDAIPPDLRQAVQNGVAPSSAGVPGNVGDLRAKGVEIFARDGQSTLDSNLIRAYSSSGTEFSYNGLNTAALLAAHLFPVSYLPDFSATLSYEFHAGGQLRITPELSYESGYPFGVGRKIWIVSPTNDKTPILVDNDNNVNPGSNYYFLRDPAQPYNASSNPYIATLGTPEGNDPNSLRSAPQTILDLHAEGDIAPHLSASIDFTNLLGEFSPTQIVSNPYLIGPPGYAGGNATWAAYYGMAAGYANPYTLGNGVPTNDGIHQILPWRFGTGGYVGGSWPAARTIQFRVRYRV
jgi:hypothetical protein